MDLFKKFWATWKRVGKRIGNFQARVLLTVLYAVVTLPFGLAVSLFSDPLRIKQRPTAWLERQGNEIGPDWAHRQW